MGFEKEKEELRGLISRRNFFFKNATRSAAEDYLHSKVDFQGLSEENVKELEETLNKSFPKEFKEYLLEFGNNCGELFCCGQDIVIAELPYYQIWAEEILENDNIDNFLDEDTFVFYFHQGYSFQYFKKIEDQFQIFLYVEGDKAPKKQFNSFQEMLRSDIDNMISANNAEQTYGGHFLTLMDGLTNAEWPSQDSGIVPRDVGDIFIAEKGDFFNRLKKLFK